MWANEKVGGPSELFRRDEVLKALRMIREISI